MASARDRVAEEARSELGLCEKGWVRVSGVIAGYNFCPRLPTPVALVKLAGRKWVRPEVRKPLSL